MNEKQGKNANNDSSKVKVKIIHGAGWYKNHIGEIFEVEKTPVLWRDGNPHYEMQNPSIDGWTHRLIECKDAEILSEQ